MRNKRGFTLIEVVIVAALVGTVGLLMFAVFGQGINLYTKESESIIEQANMREVLSDITNKARLTKPSSITCVSGILNVGTNQYTFNDQKIMKNGIVIAKDISSFQVSISGGLLNITIENLSEKSISTTISLLG